jgi:3-hydroxyacyl-CoA dehydrogenase
MSKGIHRAVVLGAGVMGSRIAAHLANAGIPTLLLDMVPAELNDAERKCGLTLESPQVRNRMVSAGVEAARKAKPAAFFVPEGPAFIQTGNFDDHLSGVAEADWIIEAVAEDLPIKRSLLARVEKLRRPAAIVSTNTSGLPVNLVAEGLGQELRRHFLGTHFFNPPRYLHLLEVIPGRDTLPEVTQAISEFCGRRLGKGIIVAKDTPNFIANRIGTFSMISIVRTMIEEGFTIEDVDAITGPAIGLPRTATFRLLDLVGLDTVVHVIRNLHENAPRDERRDHYCVPPFMEEMVRRGWIGEKAGQGFYHKIKKGGEESAILALDLASMEYRPLEKPKFPILDTAKNVEDTAGRLRLVLDSEDRAGRFAWRALSEVFLYAANRVPEISDRIVEIDRAMEWGFAWEMGVFRMWDAVGVVSTAGRLEKEGRALPDNVARLLASGATSFYRRQKGRTEYFDFGSASYQPVEEPAGVIVLAGEKERSRLIRKNPGASLIDLGDGVCCLEFHSKMNAIGADIVGMMQAGLEETAKNFEAMVIANQGANFSVGANLMLLLMGIQGQEWEEIGLQVRQFQAANMALKTAAKPVVAAPFGMALGSGCEIPLHAARIRAHAELYMGLVETGVGLIPAAGGSKEMAIRADEMTGPGEDVFENIKKLFEQTALAKVTTSAEEARRFRFLRPADSISMNRDRLVADAKAVALHMARDGYRPVLPRNDISVPGESGVAKIKLGLHLAREGQFITDYDVAVGRKLAYVMCGGNLSGYSKVSEPYLLELEREAFLSLCGEKKTQERIAHTLKTGKPLRN